jgi:branched-chain amino acid transport system permease protein
LFKPPAKAPILTNVAGFIALYAIINSVAGLIWDFTIKQYPSPFGKPSARLPSRSAKA